MTWMDSVGHKLIEHFEYREPGPYALANMADFKGRMFPINDIKMTSQRNCGWCNINPVLDGRKKYCSDICSSNAIQYCFPRSALAKVTRLILIQDCKCNLCGFDYSKELEDHAKKVYAHNKVVMNYPYKQMKSPEATFLQMADHTRHDLQVDYLLPTQKGGSGIGFHNVQVVCKSCEIIKSMKAL